MELDSYLPMDEIVAIKTVIECQIITCSSKAHNILMFWEIEGGNRETCALTERNSFHWRNDFGSCSMWVGKQFHIEVEMILA